ncbi:hypothetical protein O6H91_06G129400 [Diphasiastrum complanatum]|uniref:Uncharacterized protein n=1 Tax=Diphasiastrum complanatum TaxID=34168 RepID=A0ACC2DJ00_DIPCM|nr:hypothetical protein O6H91_06G129400 [Diphasiastrum complanatum]
MGDTPKRSRYSNSLSPKRGRSRSPSSAYNSHGDDGPKNDANNPGNNLYVTGLSTRVTEQDLEEHLSREGKVVECRLVVDPRTRASRGFGFVEMETVEDADRCIKYLNRSTLEGRIISVEKRLFGPLRCISHLFFKFLHRLVSKLHNKWPNDIFQALHPVQYGDSFTRNNLIE